MPGFRDELNGAALAQWARLCLDGLERHRDEINALNVFPIADADTGTNMLATMRAATEAVEAVTASRGGGVPSARAEAGVRGDALPDVREESAALGDVTLGVREESGVCGDVGPGEESRVCGDVAPGVRGEVVPGVWGRTAPTAQADVASVATLERAVATAMSRAAIAGARGNSGIILSQVLRGIAEGVADGPLTAVTLRIALRRAAVLVRDALSVPVEGTMLTVLEAAADRAEDCAEDTLAAVALAAADGASKALGDTPSQLSVLRAAGVVDAGARGLLVLLDALVTTVTGQVPPRPEYPGSERMRPRAVATEMVGNAGTESTRAATHRAGGIGPTAAVPGSAEATSPAAPQSDSSGQPVAAVCCAGDGVVARPHYEVMYLLADTDAERITALRESLARLGDSVVVVGDGDDTWSAHVHCADAGAAVEAGLAAGTLRNIRIEGLSSQEPPGPADRGILAVVGGLGAARLFEDAGAVVLEGAVTADALLTAIRDMPHREVVVLPNGALPAHELVAVSVAARDGSRDVLMLPSGSMVQGLAALALHDGARSAADDVFAMSEAAAATRWGALRVAPERALTIVGTCERGDGLGLVGNDVVVIDADTGAAARTLLDRMLGLGGELVTLLLGAAAPAGLSEELTEHITVTFPGVEVITYDGGQAADLVQIGVE